MGRKRRIEIRIQTDRRVVIYATGLAGTWCERCGKEREFVTPQTAGLLADSMLVEIKGGAYSPELHMAAAADGSPRICLDSLLQLAGKENKAPGFSVAKGLLPEG